MIAKKIISLTISALLSTFTLTMPATAISKETFENNDTVYILKDGVTNDFDKYEKLSFSELLSMSDEDYINLVFNGYRGDYDGASKCYNFIDPVLRSTAKIYTGKEIEKNPSYMTKTEWPLYQNELYVYSGTSDEEQNILNQEINNMLGENIFGTWGDVKGIYKYEDMTYAVMNYISSSFSVSVEYEENLEYFNHDAFLKSLNKYFGDTLDYKIYLNSGKDNYSIVFDTVDLKGSGCEYLGQTLYDPTLENTLYMSKILYVLTSVCPTASFNNAFVKDYSDEDFIYENTVQQAQEETTTTTAITTTNLPVTETTAETALENDTDMTKLAILSQNILSSNSLTSSTPVSNKKTTVSLNITTINNISSPKTGDNDINQFLFLIAGTILIAFLLRKPEN